MTAHAAKPAKPATGPGLASRPAGNGHGAPVAPRRRSTAAAAAAAGLAGIAATCGALLPAVARAAPARPAVRHGAVSAAAAPAAARRGAVSTAAAAAAAQQAAAQQPAAQQAAAHAAGPASSQRFWYGTDSRFMAVPGPAPYSEPVIGNAYGGYIGMVGNWATWQGCAGDHTVWSPTDSTDANVNFATYHKGIGTGGYWFMAGPGVDPGYNGTTGEAYAWGQAQAARTLRDLGKQITYPVVIMDVELPGHAPGYTPAPDNGWNSVYTSPCSGKVRSGFISPQVDRADVNGYAAYLTSHSSYKPGAYSAPAIWQSIFGTGNSGSVTNIYEWTYTSDTSSLAHHPVDWCLRGTSTCAQFFGGMTSGSSFALMWQWSGGGGTDNGVGDFDEIDSTRTP